jgi:hypothetical protein
MEKSNELLADALEILRGYTAPIVADMGGESEPLERVLDTIRRILRGGPSLEERQLTVLRLKLEAHLADARRLEGESRTFLASARLFQELLELVPGRHPASAAVVEKLSRVMDRLDGLVESDDVAIALLREVREELSQ